MTLTTRPVRLQLLARTGAVLPGARVRAQLTDYQVDGQDVVPLVWVLEEEFNAPGYYSGVVWPNSRTSGGTQYLITADSGDLRMQAQLHTVPEGTSTVAIKMMVNATPWPAVYEAAAEVEKALVFSNSAGQSASLALVAGAASAELAEQLGDVTDAVAQTGVAANTAVASAAVATAARDVAELARDGAVAAGKLYGSTAAAQADASLAVGQNYTAPLADGSLQAYRKDSNAASTAIGNPTVTAKEVRSPVWAGKKNGWLDPFFRKLPSDGGAFLGRSRWTSSSGGLPNVGWSLVKNDKFDGRALRRAANLGSTFLGGPAVWLDELDAVTGDTITVYVLLKGAGAIVSVPGIFRNAAGSVGPQIRAASPVGVEVLTTTAEPQWMRFVLAVPAGATSFYVYPYTATAGQTFDVVSFWAFKGVDGPSWPVLDNEEALNIRVAANEVAVAPVPAIKAKADYSTITQGVVSSSAESVVLAGSGFSAGLRNLPFSGWGERFTPANVSFNAIRVVSLGRSTAVVDAGRWEAIKVVVRTGANSATGAVVAVGETAVDRFSGTLSNLTILLRDPVTGAIKTLSDASFSGGEYFIGVYARNAAGISAACGEPFGTAPNSMGLSVSYLTVGDPLTDGWQTAAANTTRLSFQHLMLTSPAYSVVYKPSKEYSAVLLSEMPDGALPGVKLAPKSIGSSQLAAKGVTPLETNFLQEGKNKFNPATATVGSYVTPGGAVLANATYSFSDYIAVIPGVSYIANQGMRFSCYYDANKNVVAGGGGGDGNTFTTFTAPAGVSFVRATTSTSVLLSFQLETGTVSTPYEPYGYALAMLNGTPIVVPGASQGAGSPSIVVPPFIYGVQGRECNVYTDNLHYADSSEWLHDFAASYGAQQRDRWTWTPAAGVAAGTLTYSAHDKRTGTLLASGVSQLRAAAATAGTGTNKKVLVIGDSWVNAGVITQTLIDNAAADAMGVTLYGTRGAGANKHEGRGGWTINDYSTAGRTYRRFEVSGVTQVPSLNATTYSDTAGSVYTVQEAAPTGPGSWMLDCSVSSGPSTPPASGVLTKTNVSAGDATLNFSATSAVPANPFWIGGAVNFSQYLTNNSIPELDWVTIGLGVNDAFGQSNDAACAALADAEFAKLDTLIASIKASGAGTRVALLLPGPGANQDAFAVNYGVGQTAWRYKRNMMIWASRLITKYAGLEASRIYIVPTNTALDTANNMPVDAGTPINSRNPTLVVRQNNGVHPWSWGYQQIGDALWAFLKFFSG